MLLSTLDCDRLDQAQHLAEGAVGLSDPNPRVGCVIGFDDGRVIGQGHTQAAGGAHAEVAALQEAAAAGASTSGATAWVTLEPCSHHGRTPPCCDALIRAGLARVVVSASDPFPAVGGMGLQRLRAAGLQVHMGNDGHARATRELNIGFFSRIERGRPWVRIKAALSLDGRTALANGRSQWITGPLARSDGHAWRRRAGAVLTGIGTVLADDPRLDVRLVPTTLQPLRVVVDSLLRLPAQARLLGPPGRVLVATTRPDPDRQRALASAGAEIWLSPTAALADQTRGPSASVAARQGVALGALMHELAARQINELHVEAGARLNGALAAAGLADEWLLYQAPVLLGPGPGLLAWAELSDLSHALRLVLIETTAFGADQRLRLRPAERRDS